MVFNALSSATYLSKDWLFTALGSALFIISFSLFFLVIALIIFMIVSSSKINMFALKKDNYISISLNQIDTKILNNKKSSINQNILYFMFDNRSQYMIQKWISDWKTQQATPGQRPWNTRCRTGGFESHVCMLATWLFCVFLMFMDLDFRWSTLRCRSDHF